MPLYTRGDFLRAKQLRLKGDGAEQLDVARQAWEKLDVHHRGIVYGHDVFNTIRWYVLLFFPCDGLDRETD